MKKIIDSQTKIRFQDCDPFNHLNNAKYLDYFMNAREDQMLTHYGFDVYGHFVETNQNWVVLSNQIFYSKPVALMEKVTIISQLIGFTSSTLSVEMTMWSKDKTKLKAIYWPHFIYFHAKKRKRVKHSKELTRLFTAIVDPVDQPGFETRCKHLLHKKD